MMNDAGQVQAKQKTRSLALPLATSASGVVILVSLFRWTLVEHLTVFLEPVLEIATALFFAVALIWAIVHAIRSWKYGVRSALTPVLICLFAGAVVALVPFTELTTDFDFRTHYAARSAVVSDVLAGNYDSHVGNSGTWGDFIALPAKLSYLSSGGGEILRLKQRDRTLIFFFSFRGILGNFSGFVYSTNNVPPANGDFGARFVEIVPLRQNWFWAASRN